MTSEERVANILKAADSEAKAKKPAAQVTSTTNVFAEYQEKLRVGDDDDDDVNDTTGSTMPRQSVDALGNTEGTLDGTGMVRFGSMDGPNALSMIQKREEQEDTKDDSLQAFLEESDDSDEKPRDESKVRCIEFRYAIAAPSILTSSALLLRRVVAGLGPRG